MLFVFNVIWHTRTSSMYVIHVCNLVFSDINLLGAKVSVIAFFFLLTSTPAYISTVSLWLEMLH